MLILENTIIYYICIRPTCGHVGVVVVLAPALVVPVEGVEAPVGGQVIFMARPQVPPQNCNQGLYENNML